MSESVYVSLGQSVSEPLSWWVCVCVCVNHEACFVIGGQAHQRTTFKDFQGCLKRAPCICLKQDVDERVCFLGRPGCHGLVSCVRLRPMLFKMLAEGAMGVSSSFVLTRSRNRRCLGLDWAFLVWSPFLLPDCVGCRAIGIMLCNQIARVADVEQTGKHESYFE